MTAYPGQLSPISALQRLTLTGLTAAGSFALQPNAVLVDIIVSNTTANAITGGLKFGTTAGGVDIMAALAVGANAIAPCVLLLRAFSRTAAQTIFFDTVTSWNSANVTIDVFYYQL